MKSVESVLSEAMLLPPDQRLAVAHRILASVEPEANAEIEEAWDQEIRARLQKYDLNPAAAIPAEEVFTELDKKLK